MALTTSTDLRHVLRWIPEIPGHYNWTGKVLELVVSIIAILLLMGLDGWSEKSWG